MTDLIPFPLQRNIGKARHVAAIWHRKRTERARTTYWCNIVDNLECRLRRLGFTDEQVDEQIGGFRAEVEGQINMLIASDCSSGRS